MVRMKQLIRDSTRSFFPFLMLCFFPGELAAQHHTATSGQFLFSPKQKFLVERYTTESGLSDDMVMDILQDQRGYIWIATTNGLNRFNGYDFTVFKYRPGQKYSISNNSVNDLYEDAAGRIWIATDEGLNMYDPLTEQFKNYQHDAHRENSVLYHRTRIIYEDKDGILWLGTHNGLNRFDKEKETFELYQHQETHSRFWETKPAQEISEIIEDGEGNLIIGYWGMGMMWFDKTRERFRLIPVNNKIDSFALNFMADGLEKDGKGKIWITAANRLFYLAKENGFWNIREDTVSYNRKLSLFVPTSSGQYMVGGDLQRQGFYLLDKDFKNIDFFTPGSMLKDPNNFWVQTMFEDQAGDIWLGTRGAGIYHLNTRGSYFTNFRFPVELEKGAGMPNIRALVERNDGRIWMATSQHGILVFDRKTNTFQSAPKELAYPNGLLTNRLASIHKDKRGNIWIGTWQTGVSVYVPASKEIQHFQTDYKKDNSLSDRFIYQFLETKEGEIWIGTTSGVSVLFTQEDIQSGNFRQYKPIVGDTTSINHPYVYCLYQRQNGEIWVGTEDGLHRYDRQNDAFIGYKHHIDHPNSISSSRIRCIFEDEHQQMWIGTSSGLNRFDDAENSFDLILTDDGSLEGEIYSVRADDQGRLWVGTNQGLVRYHARTGTAKAFYAQDGFLNGAFRDKGLLISEKTGEIYVGGRNGLSVFHPDSIEDNSFIPRIHISKVKIYNVKEDQGREAKVKDIASEQGIKIPYRDNNITFELTGINYRNSHENQYAYRLEGFNDNWVSIGTRREVTFTNLDPGKYTLFVKGSNDDGLWNEESTSLNITIFPPWWATWWAYLSYALLLIGVGYGIFYFLKKRWKLQNALQLEQAEAQRLKELDSFKSKLYTNLTHEFRTPLTVILGMTQQIRNEPKKFLESGTRLIESNGKNLLRLINQLLDLSKLENQSLQLQLQQGNIVPHLRYITESFQTYANGKNLSLRFFSNRETLMMDYDSTQMQQVLTNLISNALKFTPPDGEVWVRLEGGEDQLEIEVQDTGIGIAEKDLPHVFDRFYQVDNTSTRKGEGTGIGLAHAKELVKLMGGRIHVKSELGKGTEFRVSLPVHRTTEVVQNEMVPALSPSLAGTIGDDHTLIFTQGDAAQVLVIEDNQDVVLYLRSCLGEKYDLQIALNGKIGIEKALKDIPDLIISDVMMPEKNGYEVCDTLKNDERTSHIPIILLTAKADSSSKISGLERGADAYLIKPFDKEELFVRLESLLNRQKKMTAYFSSRFRGNSSAEKEDEEAIQIEHSFLQKVQHIVAEHYQDEDFALPQLCQKIRMSRSQLFRKMKALIGTSPSAFIRDYRLNQARNLIQTTELNVSEIAWRVGYKNLAHFSKSFQEKFGYPPSGAGK